MTLQYAIDLPPALRANSDYIFVFKEPVLANREKLYKNFFGIFPTFDMFNKVMDACTENYECIVLDNTSKSNRIEDCVFWYKAKMHKNFKVGAPEYWHAHKKMFNPKRSSVNRLDPKAVKNKSALKITKTR